MYLLTNIFTTPLFDLSGKSISLLWIIEILGLLILVSIFAGIIKQILKNRILLTLKISDSNREVISTLISFGIAGFGYIITIQIMGINVTSLAVILGGLGVGIGLGFQDLTRNLISGITLLGEGKLRVGDLIEFQGKLGYICEISIRCTIVKTPQGSQLIIPNTELTNSVVVNWHYDNYQGRIEIPVSVAYGSDLLVVTDVLLQSALMVKQVLHNPPPQVVLLNFGDNALIFSLWVWVERVDRAVVIKSSLLSIIEYSLRQNKINIPFPQRDVWLQNVNPINDLSQPINSPSMSHKDTSKTDQSLKDLLLKFTLFQNFNDLQLLRLIEMSHQRYLQSEEIFIKQGDYGNFFVLILEGEIEVIFETNTTKESLFFFLQGQYFGELPLLLKTPYPTTMKAKKNTRLLLINEENFHLLLKQYPFLAEQIIQELGNRQDMIQSYKQQLEDMGLLNNEEINNPLLWVSKYFQQIFVTK